MAATNRTGMRELAQTRLKNLRVVPPGTEEDPVGSAIRTKRQVLGESIIDGTVVQVKADQVKAAVDLKRSERELRNLEREEATVSQDTSTFQQYLIGEMQKMQGEFATLQQSLAERDRELMEAKLQALRDELKTVTQALAVPQSQSGLEALRGQLDTAREYLALIKDLQPDAPPTPMVSNVDDPSFVAWKETFDFRKEQWREERKERNALLEAQNANERYKIDQDLELKKAQLATYNRALDDTLPRIGGILSSILEMFQNRFAAPAAVAAPVVAPAQEAPRTVQPPPGAIVDQCPNCQAPIVYFEDTPHRIVCTNCGASIVVSVKEPEYAPGDREEGSESPA